MMDLGNTRVKWPYVTHLVDPARVRAIAPSEPGHDPGALVLARVVSLSRHRELESHEGRRMALYPGDVFVGVLGDRYATDQYFAYGRLTGSMAHIVGLGGVVGDVVSMHSRMIPPTTIEVLGRVADASGRPLRTQQFQSLPVQPLGVRFAPTILSLGASMNAGKTTTASQLVHSLSAAGYRVAAGKLTGTACRKDLNSLHDAGAVAVLDFTHAGWPSTANLELGELLAIAGRIRAALEQHAPDFVVLEIADGIIQRETAMLLADDDFRASVDAVMFSGPDALSCDGGVRRLRALGGPTLLAAAGPVANSALGIAEVEAATGLRCLSGEMILDGALTSTLRALREHMHANGGGGTPVGAGDRETVPRSVGAGRAAS